MSKKCDFLSKNGWLCQRKKYYEIVRVKILFILNTNFIIMAVRKRVDLDDVQRALIAFFKKNTGEEWVTLREIAAAIGVNHPQTVLNKLNQLILKGYFVKDNHGYRLIRESVTDKMDDIVQIPVFGFAQCGHNGKRVIDEYTQENIPVTMAFIGTSDVQNCFFVRAKWDSMEPKIQDWDLVLIRQQPNYDPNDFVFIVHNNLPKLKKIVKHDNKFYLESVNRFFEDVELSEYDESKVVWVVKKIIKNM